MKIEFVEISTIKPYPQNIKKHPQTQIDRLIESIKEFGWVQPIVIDENSVILIGHGRYEAAKQMGADKVPVQRQINYTEEQKRSLRIIDNKLNADAPYDLAHAETELRWLKESSQKSAELYKAFGLQEMSLPMPTQPKPPEEKPKGETANETPVEKRTVITLQVLADDKDAFLEDLDLLLQNYNDVKKKVL